MEKEEKYWTKIYQQNDNIVTRKIADETILVPIKGNLADMQRIFMLNPVAEYIWDNLNNDKHLKIIRTGVVNHFDVRPTDAEKDIIEFINQLIKLELVAEVGNS